MRLAVTRVAEGQEAGFSSARMLLSCLPAAKPHSASPDTKEVDNSRAQLPAHATSVLLLAQLSPTCQFFPAPTGS